MEALVDGKREKGTRERWVKKIALRVIWNERSLLA